MVGPLTTNIKHALCICQYDVARIVNKGFLHADLHLTNIMYNLTITNYLGETFPGKAMSIDVGIAGKVTKPFGNRITTLLKCVTDFGKDWYTRAKIYKHGTRANDNW
jgi:predicted unusual protein kinase regulating ubiquinone biosynthesis (AarF/ABC1/UbiB family)